MTTELDIRQMSHAEVGELVQWAADEGWNPGLHDAELFWATDPDAFIAADLDGELIGGGQRIHEYDLLMQKLVAHKLPQEAFDWYLDLRKFGSVPHGGFGMGIERCVAWICGIEHVRETIPFPRMIYRMKP